jgi:hypothetical protein
MLHVICAVCCCVLYIDMYMLHLICAVSVLIPCLCCVCLQCGSCWTFATTAAVEGLNAIKSEYTSLYSLSEQQVLDCGSTGSPNGDGCLGNSIDAGLSYTLRNKGLTSGDAYPYTATDNTCKVEAEAWKVSKINSYTWVPANDETALMKAVAYGVSIGAELHAPCGIVYSIIAPFVTSRTAA